MTAAFGNDNRIDPLRPAPSLTQQHAQAERNKEITALVLLIVGSLLLLAGFGCLVPGVLSANGALIGAASASLVTGMLSMALMFRKTSFESFEDYRKRRLENISGPEVNALGWDVLLDASLETRNNPQKSSFILKHSRPELLQPAADRVQPICYCAFIELLKDATPGEAPISHEMAAILARFPSMVRALCRDANANRVRISGTPRMEGENLLPTAQKVREAADLIYFYMLDQERRIFVPEGIGSLIDEEEVEGFVHRYIAIMESREAPFVCCESFMRSLPQALFDAFAIHILPPNEALTVQQINLLVTPQQKLIQALHSQFERFAQLILEGKVLTTDFNHIDPRVADFLVTDWPRIFPRAPTLGLENQLMPFITNLRNSLVIGLADLQELNRDEKRLFCRHTPLEQYIEQVHTPEEAREILGFLVPQEEPLQEAYMAAFKTLLQKATEGEEPWSRQTAHLMGPLRNEIIWLYREATRPARRGGLELNPEADLISQKVAQESPLLYRYIRIPEGRAAFFREHRWDTFPHWTENLVAWTLRESLGRELQVSAKYDDVIRDFNDEEFRIAQRLIARYRAEGPFTRAMDKTAQTIEARRQGRL